MDRYPLEWIDEYVARLRDFICVREEDALLIKVPNEAYKLNPSGVKVLRRLLDGESVLSIWAAHGKTDAVRRDLYDFFVGLKRVLRGCVNEDCPPPGVTARPFALGFNTLPVLSEVAVTYRCNLACRFCYAGCSCRKDADASEMTTDQVRRVLRTIRDEAKVPSVSFTGGEPTLREDLPELVRYARQDLALRVNLITNGTLLTGTLVSALASAGLNSAQVSVEAATANVHDRLTQSPGSWTSAVAGIKRLQHAGIRVHTNTTLNRDNLAEACAMPAFAKGLGLERFSMNLVIPVGTTEIQDDLILSYRETAEWIPRIQQAAQQAGVVFMWYAPTPLCIFNPVQHQLGNKGCAACDGLLSVAPNGDVLPCSSWPEPVGNLLTGAFDTIWRSSRGQWLREKQFAHDRCKACEHFALCQGACPLYWRRFGYEELTGKEALHVAASG